MTPCPLCRFENREGVRFCEQCGGTLEVVHHAPALATELGMCPLVAHCHFGLGTLYRRTGQRDAAYEHLPSATTMDGEMDMGLWLERAAAELAGPG